MKAVHDLVQNDFKYAKRKTAVYFCFLLFRKSPLLLSEIAALFITEKQHHCTFIHSIIMTFIVSIDDVPLCFYCAPGGKHRRMLNQAVKNSHQHSLNLPFSPAHPCGVMKELLEKKLARYLNEH